MKLITIAQARSQVKSDGDDDDQLTVYCDAAEAACARLANRSLFATTVERDAAIAAISAAMTAAYTAYDAAIATALTQDDDRIAGMQTALADVALLRATNKAEADLQGLSLEELGDAGKDIPVAVLMTAAHWYRNRENVTSGQGATAIEVPMSAQYIMYNHRWHGPL